MGSEVRSVDPRSDAARRLLAEYIDELKRRLAGGYETRAEWDTACYGGARGRVLVAYEGGVAVACAGLREHARDAGELKHFYVAPSARRRGIGSALVGAIEDEARDLGFRRVVLDTAAPLEEAARLYERCGYRPAPAFNDNPYAAKWFDKTLPLDDRALWGAFSHSSLPQAEWNHEAHLRVAFLHVARHPIDESHVRMRAGIIRLNASHGLVEGPERGYHETLTRVWLALVADAKRTSRASDSRAFVADSSAALGKSAPLRFYTRETLLSLRARAVFVEPDLAPLPVC